MADSWRGHLEAQRQAVLDRCTTCGDCFRVCPIVPLAPLKDASPEAIVAGVLDILRGDPAPAETVTWAQACTRCGRCIEACGEGVNPRKMLALGEGLAHEAAGSQAGSQFFRLMSQNIHLLSGLQLSRERLEQIQGPPQQEADVVFYVGCNLLSNPHIILNVMELLSAVGADYQMAGGTGYCCGVIHFLGGELDAAGRVGATLFDKLAAFRPRTVLTWCPTCEMHLQETYGGQHREFEIEHLTDFLVANLDTLRKRFRAPLRRRVAVHGHGGLPHISDNVRRLLAAVPQLEAVYLHDGGDLGYSCNVGGLLRMPSLQAEVQSRVWQEAREAGAQELVDLYHGCHRLLWDREGGLPVRNFTDLLVEGMGLPAHEDRFQRYRAMPGVQQVLEAARDLMEENGIDPAEVQNAFPVAFQR